MEEENKGSKGLYAQIRDGANIVTFDMDKYKNMSWKEFVKIINDTFSSQCKKK